MHTPMVEPLVDLRGRVVFLTGAAGGQGIEHARLLSRIGARVVLADLYQTAVQKVAEDIEGDTLTVELDVQDQAAWHAAFARTRDVFGRVDVLVNNAGRHALQGLEQLDPAELDRTIGVNLVGAILGMRHVLPLMEPHGGSIINVASTAALTGYPGGLAYCASKWGLRGASKSAARELGPRGIRVNCLVPGAIDTTMISETTRSGGGAVAAQPIARVGAPGEVSRLLAFLASDASSYCTGQEFVIDGGQST